jgi:nucleoside-diphosphate-sugar epimerase
LRSSTARAPPRPLNGIYVIPPEISGTESGMKFLIIGGTQLSGPFLLRRLKSLGHQVTVFHRGLHQRDSPAGIEHIIAPRQRGPDDDRYHLRAFANEFRRVRADVVIHMIAFTREDAQSFVSVFKGFAGRAVVPSSSDVYRAMGIINRTEPGPPIPVPIDEDGPLREKLSIHGSGYEKRWVEQVVLGDAALPACMLRFPAVYGPGAYRRQDWIKRMLDGRPAIILGRGEATFRFSHGYAEDVGEATALAAVNECSADRIYNVGERNVPTERQRLQDFARVAGWDGHIVEVDDEIVPGGDGLPYHGQDWLLNTKRIRRDLGFEEVADYEQGIRHTIAWQKSNPDPAIDLRRFDYAAEDRLLAEMNVSEGGRAAV